MSKIQFVFPILVSLLAFNQECSCEEKGEFVADYKEALKLSLLFYEAQRSGKLPSNNRIKWRGDSALNDRGVNGEDLTGGYYDGSDFVKFGFTMAFATTILSWGVIKYKDAYQAADQYTEVLDAIKWSTDYFIKCHVSKNELYGQVGNFPLDHAFWGRPEEMNMNRPAFKIDETHPGTDLAGEASALFSSASIVFRNVNESYSRELLRHAIELYDFANNYRGLSQDVIPGAKQYYESCTCRSTSFGDELTWAAAWLYKATKNPVYLGDAQKYYQEFNVSKEVPNKFFYKKQTVGIQVLLAESTGSSEYIEPIKSFCDNSVDTQLRTPEGLIFIHKSGTLPHAANIAFLCLIASDLPDMPSEKYTTFAKEQIDYILGATGRSYVVGYGENFTQQPYHSASSCPDKPLACGWDEYHSKQPNPQILYGALVSGPDQNDHYEDRREEFLYNEVTVDYNAGFQSALAGLIQISDDIRVSAL
ncbi:uncharacterized protein LOC108908596 isoform X2 [Anoplophora glabripennis]|uniref:uncharacterized protein LOC108908596 isoform X1 n=1 Tax=Anoplophora glabripennis TaxID=217634 RepID=UPI00087561C7|nr:uncharacterized protein LOC108908596 isoform X1 [Anoplophora glabripennis]XP_018568195.1 uncharacterized protein LOC108908596 isoform X1 [Anoplophora glabripennis]XP_023310346.1 uncharacterized protein LOC108908596 isoform X2 [Anoplophora glabripennis]